MEAILAAWPHPQQSFRSCRGLMRLAKQYGPERLEAACARALALEAVSYRSVESIVKKELDKRPLAAKRPEPAPVDHDNIRGPEYYR